MIINNISTPRYVELPDREAKLMTSFSNAKNYWTRFNEEFETIFNGLEVTGMVQYFTDKFELRFYNKNIGFNDVGIFWLQINTILQENYIPIVFHYLGVRNLDLKDIVKQASPNTFNKMTHYENNGQYQKAKWQQSDNTEDGVDKSMMTNASEDVSESQNATILSVLKGLMNKPIVTNINRIMDDFNRLFTFNYKFDYATDREEDDYDFPVNA